MSCFRGMQAFRAAPSPDPSNFSWLLELPSLISSPMWVRAECNAWENKNSLLPRAEGGYWVFVNCLVAITVISSGLVELVRWDPGHLCPMPLRPHLPKGWHWGHPNTHRAPALGRFLWPRTPVGVMGIWRDRDLHLPGFQRWLLSWGEKEKAWHSSTFFFFFPILFYYFLFANQAAGSW